MNITKELNVITHQSIEGVSTIYAPTYGKSNRIIGSPYLYEEFRVGSIHLKDDSVFSNILLRYDIYKDIIEFLNRRDTFRVNQPLMIDKIVINNRTFIGTVYKKSENVVDFGYFEILVDGKMKLLKKYKAEVDVDIYMSNYMGGGGSKKKRFITKEYYYIKKDKKTAELIDSRYDLYQLFPEKKQELRKHIKENKLRFTDEKSIIAVFKQVQ